MNRRTMLRAAGGVAGAAWAATAAQTLFGGPGTGRQILNASYDATRELYRNINRLFSAAELAAGRGAVRVRASHGGSGSQARAVRDGLPADVVTLALWPDTNELVKAGLIDAGWESRLPNRSLPYTSTIVFVVRRGNPFNVRDWPDLISRDGLRIIAANPKTGGAAKLSFISAWGAVKLAGGSDREAEDYIRRFYARVPVLESSSRGATVTFARKMIGDVQLTWENEARLQARELPGEVEIVYPRRSVLAEPHVAVVDANARRAGTADVADQYLRYLYDPAAQHLAARYGFRPTAVGADDFPEMERFSVAAAAGGWAAAQARFFADGGLFEQAYGAGR